MTSGSKTVGGGAAPPSGEVGPRPSEVGESLLVAFAMVEGVAIGAWLGLFPLSALRAGGFPPAAAFFVRWAGLLHVVLATGYALEWLRFRRTALLVIAKGTTALFLGITWLVDRLPPLMVLAIIVEAVMAISGALLHGPADRSRRARARLRLVTPAPTEIRPAGRF